MYEEYINKIETDIDDKISKNLKGLADIIQSINEVKDIRYIYQNAKTGKSSYDLVLNIRNSKKLANLLEEISKSYEESFHSLTKFLDSETEKIFLEEAALKHQLLRELKDKKGKTPLRFRIAKMFGGKIVAYTVGTLIQHALVRFDPSDYEPYIIQGGERRYIKNGGEFIGFFSNMWVEV